MTRPNLPNDGQTQPPPADPHQSEAETQSRKRAGRRLLVIGVVVVIALAGALAVGTLPRLRQQHELDATSAQAAAKPPRVTVAVAERMAPTAQRTLPGNSLPLMEAALYAR